MSKSLMIGLVLGVLMVLAAVLTKAVTPIVHISESRPALMLSEAIPLQFGEWKEEKNLASVVVNPQMEATIKRIYAQTLSRTYVNSDGERIMLSIAYGNDQRDAVQLHYPEVCYPAQGFQVISNRQGVLVTSQGTIPVRRLETNFSNKRFEPVTYWTTVGDEAVTGGISKKIAEMRYGLKGEIPDGLLFRISSINTDTQAAFALQDSFTKALLNELQSDMRLRLAGLGMASKVGVKADGL
ncbi:MAG: exosortase-associated protein EpsI, B-type [Pseudomonadota bacterium]